MKSKTPEIVALILVVLALFIPPWKIFLGDGAYYNEWALVLGTYGDVIDVLLLLTELLVIAGIYLSLKLILKSPKT
jgi:uncharacterized membrane protein YqaE (UPF0057 family)